MAKQCDNKSVGVIIKKGGLYACIKRFNFPVSYAFVAGHLDGDTPEDAAVKESGEEVNIRVQKLLKVHEKNYANPCKRDGGTGHYWYVFEATEWEGELKAGSDAKEASWKTKDEIQALADRTHAVAKGLGVSLEDYQTSTALIVGSEEWQKEPGLEPIWVVILEAAGTLKN